MSEARRVAQELGGDGKPHGKNNYYKACCPVHNERNPSMDVWDVPDGITYKCWSGNCSQDQIDKELERRGIYQRPKKEKRTPKAERVLKTFQHPLITGEFVLKVAQTASIARVHVYKRRGKPYKAKIRLDNPRDFRWIYWNEEFGQWRATRPEGLEEFPYRWDEVEPYIKTKVIHFPEGERDVETLESFGFLALTTGGDSDDFKPEFLNEFGKGCRAVVWVDNDAGKKTRSLKRGRTLCSALYNRGVTVKMVMTEQVKDVTDWVATGAKKDDLASLMLSTKVWIPEADQLKEAAKQGAVPLTAYDLGSQSFAGEYFADKYKNRIKYVFPHNEWFRFDGQVWIEDEGLEHREMAKALCPSLRKDMGLFDVAARKQLEKLAKEVQTDRGVRAVISMARSVKTIKSHIDAFDTEETAHLFNCASGIVNLRTGEIAKHDPKYLLTKRSKFKVDFDKEPTLFLQFLQRMFPGDQAVVNWLIYFLAYCLSGETSFQHFLMMTGESGTGKSQLQKIISSIAGDYSSDVGADSFRLVHQRPASVDSDLAQTKGSRVIFASELSSRYKLDESVIKALTGGDPVPVKFMGENRFPLRTNAKLIFTANARPPLSDDAGIARRLLELRLEHKVQNPDERSGGYAGFLLQECGDQIAGFLIKRAVEGYRSEWRMLSEIPAYIRGWTDDYLEESDLVKQFADECVHSSYASFVSSSAMFDAFNKWCKEGRYEHDLNKITFCKRLKALGFKDGKNGTDIRGFKDVALAG